MTTSLDKAQRVAAGLGRLPFFSAAFVEYTIVRYWYAPFDGDGARLLARLLSMSVENLLKAKAACVSTTTLPELLDEAR